MAFRLSKCALLLSLTGFYLLVVFNNLTDYDSNYQFVHHVLLMDSTFKGNAGMWRALPSTLMQHIFYDSIILWETVTAGFLSWGVITMVRQLRSPAAAFNRAKHVAVYGLTLSLLMWLVAFLSIGAEWFLMWQSKTWNGQEAAGRMFNVVSVLLVYVALPDGDLAA